MAMHFLRHLALLVISLSLNGCMGIGLGAFAFWAPSESSDAPKALYERGALHIAFKDPGGSITTSSELRKQWGEPDKIILHDGRSEEWIYKQPHWRWYGVTLYAVVVGVPLMLPVGSEYVSLTVKDGQLAAATRVRSVVSYAFCGYFAPISNKVGCDTGTLEGKK